MGHDPDLTSGQAGLSWSDKLMPGCDSGPNSTLRPAHSKAWLSCVCEMGVSWLCPVYVLLGSGYYSCSL